MDANRNISLYENQLYVGNTDELDSREENMNFDQERAQGSYSVRDLGEEIVNNNDNDVALNIGKEGHVKNIISKFSSV